MTLYDKDIEKYVLMLMVYKPELIPNICNECGESDFYFDINKDIFRIINRLKQNQKRVDIGEIFNEYKKEGVYIASMSEENEMFRPENWKYYAETVRHFSMARGLVELTKSVHDIDDKNIDKKLADIISGANKIAENNGGSEILSAREILGDAITRIEGNFERGGKMSGYDWGLEELNKITDGIQNEYIIIGARASVGKAQPLYSKIKTVSGWKAMGDIKIGDELASVDGAESKVIGVYPQGIKDVYEITFSDGRKARSTDEHLWEVNNCRWEKETRIVETKDIINMLKAKRNTRRINIPLSNGEFGNNTQLPVDPWFLGFYLGDGWCKGSNVMFSNNDLENIERVVEIVGKQNVVYKAGKYDYRIKKAQRDNNPSDIYLAIESVGLSKVNSFTKFIPEEYKNSSREIRMQLLSGLISSDGNVEKNGTISYSSASETLIDDIIELARSLGCIVPKHERLTFYTYKGEKKAGSKSYRINILMTNEMKHEVLYLKRQIERIREGRTRKNLLSIKEIKYIGKEESQCIMVSHPRHLYITDDYVVTHNTGLALNVARELSKNKIPTGYFSLEMSGTSLMLRIISDISSTESGKIRSGFLGKDQLNRIVNAGDMIKDFPLYVVDKSRGAFEKIMSQCRYMVRVMGIKVIFIDHASLVKHPDKRLKRYEQFSEISNDLQNLQRELNVPIILLAQLGRDTEGQMPSLADLRESGSFEQDADQVILLHRERVTDAEKTNIPTVAYVAKNRNGACGFAKLSFLPQYARFIDDVEKSKGNR